MQTGPIPYVNQCFFVRSGFNDVIRIDGGELFLF